MFKRKKKPNPEITELKSLICNVDCKVTMLCEVIDEQADQIKLLNEMTGVRQQIREHTIPDSNKDEPLIMERPTFPELYGFPHKPLPPLPEPSELLTNPE